MTIQDANSTDNPIPLCVDLDGTLINTDTASRASLQLLKHQPWRALWLAVWFMKQGVPYCKAQVAKLTSLNIAQLPWHHDVLEYVKAEIQQGRTALLVTGTTEQIAHQVANYLREEHNIAFHQVMASSDTINLTGKNKASALIQKYGSGQFDYIGNELKDQHIWHHCAHCLVVDRSGKLQQQLSNIEFYKVFC